MDGVLVPDDVDLGRVVGVLRDAGAQFAIVFGSRVNGRKALRAGADLDIGAWLPDGVRAHAIDVGDRVDLVDLRRLPLSIAGRVALDGIVLFDDDPPARVHWQATTRTRYFDEEPRRRQFTADALEAAASG